ncbi:MAG: SAF domain-containing protein, partial [Clostridia bacterium]|nr:SAF domain-containing protein [Clostridia bacterium]
MQEFIKINREDTVAVALKPLSKGSTVAADQNTVVLKENIPQGHKFAVCQMPEGAPVIKYGCRIGYASQPIQPGDWVHIHNVRTALGDVLEYQYKPQIKVLPKASRSSFMGYKRGGGDEKCGGPTELGM